MKVKQSGDNLIIQETPGCLWLVGLFFAVIGGIFIYGSLGGFSNWNEVPLWQLGLAFLMGSISVAVGIWQIWGAPANRIVINGRTKTITHIKSGLAGREKTVYGFDRIKRFCTVEEKDSENDPIWYFALKLTSGQIIRISSLPSHFEEIKQNIVFEANDFMRKQMLSFQSEISPAGNASDTKIKDR